MPVPSPPAAAEATEPRLPASLVHAAGDELDAQFPDLDGLDLGDETLRFPEARTLTVLRSRLRSCSLTVGDAAIDAQDAYFVDVDLSGHRFEGLRRVRFERCRLTGADFGDTRLRDVRFEDCALDLTSFRGSTLERVAVVGGRLDEADLSAARCSDVVVAGVDLSNITLTGARLERVDVTEAAIEGVADLRELRGAILSPAQVVSLAARLARVAGMSVAGAAE